MRGNLWFQTYCVYVHVDDVVGCLPTYCNFMCSIPCTNVNLSSMHKPTTAEQLHMCFCWFMCEWRKCDIFRGLATCVLSVYAIHVNCSTQQAEQIDPRTSSLYDSENSSFFGVIMTFCSWMALELNFLETYFLSLHLTQGLNTSRTSSYMNHLHFIWFVINNIPVYAWYIRSCKSMRQVRHVERLHE